jgi:predicted permease
MRFWHIVRSRYRSLFFRDDRESDLREELQFHIEKETERLEASGVRADLARQQALRKFGAVEPTKEQCRDARGTAVADGLIRDVRYAWRSFLRAPLVAVTIVATVGLGLGLVTVVFTVLNAYIFRADAVRNPEELFAVERQPSAGSEDATGFTRQQYDALIRDTNLFSETFATTGDVAAWIDGVRREGRLVTGNFFRVLGASAARGRVLLPSDDEQGGALAIVLSDRAWQQYFASDPGVLDRPLLLNGAQFHVVGIMPEDFRGLEPVAAPDFWAPLALRSEFRRGAQGDASDLRAVGRLKPGVSTAQAITQLRTWDLQQPAERPRDRTTPSLVLEPRPGTVPLSTDTLLAFMPLFFAFGLILVIGCANVANLLLARAVARQQEIGIRLAIGASRRRIIWQLLTENLLLALVSAVVAFFISRLVLIGVMYVVMTTFPPDIGNIRLAVPPADWRVALFLLAGAFISTIFFALAPALQSTRLDLVHAIRGDVVRNARPGRARDLLVVMQVTGSVLLLICAGIFLRSSWAASTVDPGLRTEGIVSVRLLNEPSRGAVLDMLTREPLVETVAASWPGQLGGLGALPAFVQGPRGRSPITYQFSSPEYFTIFGIDLVRGRGFTAAERTVNDAVAIVSAKTARQLWPDADPLGQVLRIEPDIDGVARIEGGREIAKSNNPLLAPRSVVVVGVARDVAGIRLAGVRIGEVGVYLPVSAEAPAAVLTMNVRGDAERARHVIVDRLAAINPNAGEVSTLRTIARGEVYLLSIPFWLTLVLGTLALMLTLTGLFSVLSYLVERRTREIGVRMALGATRRNVSALVLWQSARPVGIGVLVGVALTSGMAALLLATPAAETIGSTVRLFDPLAYIGSLLCIVAACAGATLVPALRAGRINPLIALRQD